MANQNRFNFGWAEALAGNLDRVVGATQNVPETIFIDSSPIAVDPDIWESTPIGLQIALRILPKSARHTDPRLADDELANLPAYRSSFFIHHIGVDARHGSGKSARLERRENVAYDEAA